MITFQDKTNIGTLVKQNENQSCHLVITYLLHLDFMVGLKFIAQTCTEIFSLWGAQATLKSCNWPFLEWHSGCIMFLF